MQSFFCAPPIRYRNRQSLPPVGVTSTYRPRSSVTLYGLSLGLSARRRVSVSGMWGPFHLGLCETRSEEHTSELQSLMRISYAVFCLKKKKIRNNQDT